MIGWLMKLFQYEIRTGEFDPIPRPIDFDRTRPHRPIRYQICPDFFRLRRHCPIRIRKARLHFRKSRKFSSCFEQREPIGTLELGRKNCFLPLIHRESKKLSPRFHFLRNRTRRFSPLLLRLLMNCCPQHCFRYCRQF